MHSYFAQVKVFLKPLQAAVGTEREILTQDDILHMFVNVEMILTVNAELLNVLEDGAKTEKLSMTVAKAFCKMEAFLRIYTGERLPPSILCVY